MKQKLIQQNEILSTHLGKIEDIKKLHGRDMLYKICDNVLRRYKVNFTTLEGFDSDAYKAYIYEIVAYMEKHINPVEDLSIDTLLGLHYVVMKKLTTTEKTRGDLIGGLRDTSKYMPAIWPDGKRERRWLTVPKSIKKELKESIAYLNESLSSGEKTLQLEAIVRFVLFNLFITHPFDNGNGKTFFILLDLLLWKYDFFPVFLRNPKFDPMVVTVFDSYTPKHDFDKLVDDFYGIMLHVYNNYQM